MTQSTGTKTTKHNCGGPVFGRKTAGCPRCDELLAGAEAVSWSSSKSVRDSVSSRPTSYGRTYSMVSDRVHGVDPSGTRCGSCGADGAPDRCWNCGLRKA